MLISEKSELELLGFSPRHPAFCLVRLEWNNFVLNPMAPETQPLVDMSEMPLNDVLSQLYSKLSLIEAVELHFAIAQAEPLKDHFNIEGFYHSFGFHWNERLLQLFQILMATPQEFKNWAHQRQLGIKDLQPLLAIQDCMELAEPLKFLGQSSLSRSDGKQFLDLLVDLHLMKKPYLPILQLTEQSWLESLKKLRYPETLKNDENKVKSNSQLPKYMHLIQKRQGDRITHKLQIDFQNLEDLYKKAERLKAMEITIND